MSKPTKVMGKYKEHKIVLHGSWLVTKTATGLLLEVAPLNLEAEHKLKKLIAKPTHSKSKLLVGGE